MKSSLQIIDPTRHPGWDDLLLGSGDPSFFHSASWASVLVETYQYKPLYFCVLDKDRLALLIPFMEIHSFLTGNRGVSLPFSDQCAPFALETDLLCDAVRQAKEYGEAAKWSYSEWRDAAFFDEGTTPSETFYAHDLDLAMTESELFSSLKDNNRRNIHKAIKGGLSIRIERSWDAMRSFYELNCLTRKRHGLPPQPFLFFKNIFRHVLDKGSGIVVSAYHSEKVVASSVFFHFGTSALYKYGASDLRYQGLRPNNLIMWEAMKWYGSHAFRTLNLGRTELDNSGLLQYKRTWGARESVMKYFRFDYHKGAFVENRSPVSGFQKRVISRTPGGILRVMGRLLNRHFG